MLIKLISDLHMEHHSPESKINFSEDACDLLVIAGDICDAPQVDWLCGQLTLLRISARADRLIYVPGNHDYWGTDFDEQQRNFFLCNKKLVYSNVEIANNVTTFTIRGKTILAGTLWFKETTAARKGQRYFADFTRIRGNFTPYAMFQDFHRKLSECKPDLVVSHHMPSTALISARHKDSWMNPYFASDVPGIPKCTWCFGHTHENMYTKIDGTTFVCNPRGYNSERHWLGDYHEVMIEV